MKTKYERRFINKLLHVIASLILGVTIATFFFGCTQKQPSISRPVFVSMKAGNIRFADMGFLNGYQNGDVRLDVYSTGVPVLSVDTNGYICTDAGCMSGEAFVRQYIFPDAYKTMLCDMLEHRKLHIADSTIEMRRDGFVQRALKKGEYDLTYTVNTNSMSLREENRHFLLFMRYTDENE